MHTPTRTKTVGIRVTAGEAAALEAMRRRMGLRSLGEVLRRISLNEVLLARRAAATRIKVRRSGASAR